MRRPDGLQLHTSPAYLEKVVACLMDNAISIKPTSLCQA